MKVNTYYLIKFSKIDVTITNNLKTNLSYVYGIIGGDFLFCFIATIIDVKYYTGTKALNFFINFFSFMPLQIAVILLLIKQRKKKHIIGGYLYLIGGSILWLAKVIYFIVIIISDKIEDDYEKKYADSVYLISFLINLLIIFARVGACYIVRNAYPLVCKVEEFSHEKEQAEFLQSLGTKGEGDARIAEDEEITEDTLYKKSKNPFLHGRAKKDDNEEEEVCLQTAL